MADPERETHPLVARVTDALSAPRETAANEVPIDPPIVNRDAPTLVVEYGYLGVVRKDEAGVEHRYLFLDEALQSWLLIPEHDIVLHRRIPDAAAPYELRDGVWFRSDARVRHFSRPLHRPVEESEFRPGEAARPLPPAPASTPEPTRPVPSPPSPPAAEPEPPSPPAKPESEEARPAEQEPLAIAEFRAVAVDRGDTTGEESVEALAEDEPFQESLEKEFEQKVRVRLGPGHKVYGVEVTAGTLELLLVVGTVTTAIKEYDALRKALDQLKTDLAMLVGRLLAARGHPTAEVREVSWSPGQVMIEREPGKPERRGLLSGARDVPVEYLLVILLVFMFAVIAVLLVDALPSG